MEEEEKGEGMKEKGAEEEGGRGERETKTVK